MIKKAFIASCLAMAFFGCSESEKISGAEVSEFDNSKVQQNLGATYHDNMARCEKIGSVPGATSIAADYRGIMYGRVAKNLYFGFPNSRVYKQIDVVDPEYYHDPLQGNNLPSLGSSKNEQPTWGAYYKAMANSDNTSKGKLLLINEWNDLIRRDAAGNYMTLGKVTLPQSPTPGEIREAEVVEGELFITTSQGYLYKGVVPSQAGGANINFSYEGRKYFRAVSQEMQKKVLGFRTTVPYNTVYRLARYSEEIGDFEYGERFEIPGMSRLPIDVVSMTMGRWVKSSFYEMVSHYVLDSNGDVFSCDTDLE